MLLIFGHLANMYLKCVDHVNNLNNLNNLNNSLRTQLIASNLIVKKIG